MRDAPGVNPGASPLAYACPVEQLRPTRSTFHVADRELTQKEITDTNRGSDRDPTHTPAQNIAPERQPSPRAGGAHIGTYACAMAT
jgi:hypothetical protein